MKYQDSELSALFDGETDAQAGRLTLGAVRVDVQMRADWQCYSLIGDALRKEDALSRDITAAVMSRLQEEPVVVLAPRNVKLADRRHPLWALAATLAGVAVVGWLALNGGYPGEIREASVSPASTIVLQSQQPGKLATVSATASIASRDMQEYMIAHHAQAATFRLGDNVDHVRTVSMTTGSPRP